jgi:formylglycine-generating enzyme required for sulfatase activity
MGRFEVSNEQYRQFNSEHDSRFEHRTSWIFSEEYLGWRLNHPKQPVVRISWNDAMAFCMWLGQKTGCSVTLPTEVQWEYACRAGSAQPFSFGDLNADFSLYANMADATIRDLAYQGWRPLAPDLAPRDDRFNDHALVTTDVGSYQPNAWGLYDMHGNAAEWTRSVYKSYPVTQADATPSDERVVRGGSWRDRPWRCRSSFRLGYPAYQRIFNVGFRVILEEDTAVKTAQNRTGEELLR